MSEFTEEELALMTEAEREAVMEGEEDNSGVDFNTDDTSTDQSQGSQPDTVEGSEPEADATANSNTDATTQGEVSGAGTEGEISTDITAQESSTQQKDARPDAPFVPTFKVDKPDDLQAKLDAIDKQLDEGEIDLKEYVKARDPIVQQQAQAQLLEKVNQESAVQLWQREQQVFFTRNPQYSQNIVLYGAVDMAFKQLCSDPENQGKSGLDLLYAAKDVVDQQLAQLGASGGSGEQKKEEATPRTEEPKKEDPPPRDTRSAREKAELPRTLAGVPSAQENPTGQDEFVNLDALIGKDPVAYETALARLTPDQEQRYLRG